MHGGGQSLGEKSVVMPGAAGVEAVLKVPWARASHGGGITSRAPCLRLGHVSWIKEMNGDHLQETSLGRPLIPWDSCMIPREVERTPTPNDGGKFTCQF